MHKIKTVLGRFGLVFVSILTLLLAAPPGVEAAYPRNDVDTPITKRVLVLNYNPVFEAQGYKTAVQFFGWNDPHILANSYISAMEDASGGYLHSMVNYQIYEWRDINDIPVKRDGFDYTDDSYIYCKNQPSSCHTSGSYTDQYGQSEPVDYANYHYIIDSQNVCALANNGTIDEVWLFGGPYFGYWEARMAGPGSINTNGPVLAGPTCNRAIHFMGFNYERSLGEMLENFLHRTENSINQAYGAPDNRGGSYNLAYPTHAFMAYEARTPNLARCGWAHFPPNIADTTQYIYVSTLTKRTMCEDYWNYPYLIYPVNSWYHVRGCEQWGCTKQGFMIWWLDHLPRYKGRTDGHWDNWWKYTLDYAAAQAVPPTAEPRGNLDGYLPGSNCTVVGWTCDWSNYSQPLTVEFYEGWVKRGEVVANAWREDGVANLCGGQRYHGFTYKFPANSGMYSGGNRYVYARAKDINGSSQQTGLLWTLSNSPKAVYCNTSY